MTHMKIVPYNSNLASQWDRVVSTSKNGNWLCSRDYLSYHEHRFNEQSVLILDDDTPIAIFPCTQHGEEIVSHAGVTYAGLIYGQKLHAFEILNIFNLLGEYYRKLGIKKIRYKASPKVFHNYPADEDIYALFRMGANLYRRDLSSVIKIDNRPKFSDARKNTFRKSIKAGVQIEELSNLAHFHALLTNVLAKFDTKPVHTLSELEALRSRFPKQIRLFGARLEGELLAGAVIYDFNHVIHTQYLANSEKGRKIGSLDHVLVHLIENIFQDREYFSFGISTEQEGMFLNEGLNRQKEGFGARGIVHDFYEWQL